MINENIIRWEVIDPTGVVIDNGKVLFDNPYSYEEFEYWMKRYKPTEGIRCNRLALYCDNKNIIIRFYQDIKFKLGDKLPSTFYCNDNWVYWNEINPNLYIINIGYFYKMFTL